MPGDLVFVRREQTIMRGLSTFHTRYRSYLTPGVPFGGPDPGHRKVATGANRQNLRSTSERNYLLSKRLEFNAAGCPQQGGQSITGGLILPATVVLRRLRRYETD